MGSLPDLPENSLAFVTIFINLSSRMAEGKDLSRIKENPKGVRFSELQKAILKAGFRLVNTKGSHYVYKKGSKILTVVKPHGGHKHCHWLDVNPVVDKNKYRHWINIVIA